MRSIGRILFMFRVTGPPRAHASRGSRPDESSGVHCRAAPSLCASASDEPRAPEERDHFRTSAPERRGPGAGADLGLAQWLTLAGAPVAEN